MVYRILGKMFWQGEMPLARIIILHRGAPGDRKSLEGSSVTEVRKGWLVYQGPGEETSIPLHRVLEVWKDGELIWQRAGKAQT